MTTSQSLLIKSYYDQFNGLYKRSPWYGENFRHKLNRLTKDQAFTKPGDDIHSIAELVWHCIYWRKKLIKQLDGTTATSHLLMNRQWLKNDILQKSGWNYLTNQLIVTQKDILRLLSEVDGKSLNREYKKGVSTQKLIEGVIQHDCYHLGQIGIIAKILFR